MLEMLVDAHPAVETTTSGLTRRAICGMTGRSCAASGRCAFPRLVGEIVHHKALPRKRRRRGGQEHEISGLYPVRGYSTRSTAVHQHAATSTGRWAVTPTVDFQFWLPRSRYSAPSTLCQGVGISALIWVGPPDGLTTDRMPPATSILSASPRRPRELASDAPPRPSSLTLIASRRPSRSCAPSPRWRRSASPCWPGTLSRRNR